MKMDGKPFVGFSSVYFYPVELMGGQQQKAVGRGLILPALHQIVHVPVQEEIDLVKIVTMKEIVLRSLIAFPVAEADLIRMYKSGWIH